MRAATTKGLRMRVLTLRYTGSENAHDAWTSTVAIKRADTNLVSAGQKTWTELRRKLRKLGRRFHLMMALPSIQVALLTVLLVGDAVVSNQFYSVYYHIRLLETDRVYGCLQCFKLPCAQREIRARPLEGSLQCCRACTVVGPGKECSVYREHAAIVCDKEHVCDTNTQVCVKEQDR
ncbi:uncharacterized protein LOC119448315 [Dermacentor silvarum]|uniref:uncharacterized protein LOC119448315 n=1 Tax=Dermacentor silvarum TaxID=543639 RepID=UPI00210133EC|nr:uncharacterized protein LOC119448315 [Dermacentor silvarum]